jgi:ribosomal protein L29
MKTLEELRKLDTSKLFEELEDAKKKLFKAKFDIVSNQSKNSHLIKNNSKYVAQIKTIINAQPEKKVEKTEKTEKIEKTEKVEKINKKDKKDKKIKK